MVASRFPDWQSMIITHLMGHNKWMTAWTESEVELAGNERRRRAGKQKAPEARQRRARNERRAATRNANRNNKGLQQNKISNCCIVCVSNQIEFVLL
jgi:hypothetical protein